MTKAELRALATTIQNATTEGENTALRVGSLFNGIIDWLGSTSSGDTYATQLWVSTNYQSKGNYLTTQSLKTINGESLVGTGNITISGGGGSVTVDNALNTTSTNPVQNQVITGRIATIDTSIGNLQSALNNKAPIPGTGVIGGPNRGLYWNNGQWAVTNPFPDGHTHSNKSVLDSITAEKVAAWDNNSGGGSSSGTGGISLSDVWASLGSADGTKTIHKSHYDVSWADISNKPNLGISQEFADAHYAPIGSSGGSGGATALSGLSDVNLSTLSDGQVLKWKATASGGYWRNDTDNTGNGGGVSALSGLSDVEVNSNTLASGQVLKWNGNKWVNDTDNTGSGGSGISLQDVWNSLSGNTDATYGSTKINASHLDLSGYATTQSFTGASSSNSGTSGLVPQPLSSNADYNKFLKGNGTWSNISLALGDLNNVSISNPQIGEVLKFNGTNWSNGTDSTTTSSSQGGAVDSVSLSPITGSHLTTSVNPSTGNVLMTVGVTDGYAIPSTTQIDSWTTAASALAGYLPLSAGSSKAISGDLFFASDGAYSINFGSGQDKDAEIGTTLSSGDLYLRSINGSVFIQKGQNTVVTADNTGVAIGHGETSTGANDATAYGLTLNGVNVATQSYVNYYVNNQNFATENYVDTELGKYALESYVDSGCNAVAAQLDNYLPLSGGNNKAMTGNLVFDSSRAHSINFGISPDKDAEIGTDNSANLYLNGINGDVVIQNNGDTILTASSTGIAIGNAASNYTLTLNGTAITAGGGSDLSNYVQKTGNTALSGTFAPSSTGAGGASLGDSTHAFNHTYTTNLNGRAVDSQYIRKDTLDNLLSALGTAFDCFIITSAYNPTASGNNPSGYSFGVVREFAGTSAEDFYFARGSVTFEVASNGAATNVSITNPVFKCDNGDVFVVTDADTDKVLRFDESTKAVVASNVTEHGDLSDTLNAWAVRLFAAYGVTLTAGQDPSSEGSYENRYDFVTTNLKGYVWASKASINTGGGEVAPEEEEGGERP